MPNFAIFTRNTEAQQVATDLAKLDGCPRQEQVDLRRLTPAQRKRAQAMVSAGALGVATHVTAVVRDDDSGEFRVRIPERVSALLAEDEGRPVQQRRLNATERARVAAADAGKQHRNGAPGQPPKPGRVAPRGRL